MYVSSFSSNHTTKIFDTVRIHNVLMINHFLQLTMSNSLSKKRKSSKGSVGSLLGNRVSDTCTQYIHRHINSVYVGTIIRILGSCSYSEGRLATAHWADHKEFLSHTIMKKFQHSSI